MTVMSDLEILKSSLIYGEPEVAVKLIERKTKKLKYLIRISRKPRPDLSDHLAMLEYFNQVMTGAITIEEFRDRISGIKSLVSLMPADGPEFAIDNLTYLVQLALDRYNIQYPKYDSKRCDDR